MSLREWETLQVVPSNGPGCWVDLAALVDEHDREEAEEMEVPASAYEPPAELFACADPSEGLQLVMELAA